jgi:hypothetical protein
VKLIGFTYTDWEGNVVDRKITSGCCFKLGSRVVSWFSRKQKYVALSSTEVEYMATCEAIWLRKLLATLSGQELEPTIIHCDNQSHIKLYENPVFYDKVKAHRNHVSLHSRLCAEGCSRTTVCAYR